MLEVDEHRRMPVHSLAARILVAHEAERERIAHDVRDGLAQTLVSIKMRAARALAAVDAGQGDLAGEVLREMVPLLQGTLDEGRRIWTELRPPILDDLGIASALSWFCREFRKTHPDIELDLDVQVRDKDVPEPLKTAIYRVLQEAVDNVARHAQARHLLVVLRRGRLGIDLLVSDDGRGFDAAAAAGTGSGFGFAVMKQWAEAPR